MATILSVAVLSAAAVTGAPPASAAPTGTAPVGSAPSLPAHAAVQGAVAPTTPLQLTVVLRPRDPAGLAAMATSVSRPGSAEFRRYLAPGEFADRFGPTPATVAAVTQALAGLGLKPGDVSANRLAVSVTTTADKATAALGVRFRNVRLASGRVAYANDTAPRLPATVAPAVGGILGLDSLSLQSPHWRAPPSTGAAPTAPRQAPMATPNAAGATGPQPCAAAANAGAVFGGYTANQLAQAYSFGGLYAKDTLGAGVTIAVYELASYNPADVSTFQACYGTTTAVTNIAVDGGPHPADGGAIEAELDIEGVLSMAPKANIAVYLGPNGSGIFDTYNRIVTDDTAKVITTSWGNCEPNESPTLVSSELTLFAQAAVQGQTVVASAGDNGSEDCFSQPGDPTGLFVDNPAAQPFVTGVGGTNLTAVGPAPSETVWNESGAQLGATGGGISSNWQLPPAQHGPGVINNFSSRAPCGAPSPAVCREVPDVAASADPVNGYVIYYVGPESGIAGWQTIAGTSAAAPLWAALIALGDQTCSCGLGFLNSALYNIAAKGPGSFNDIAANHGNNDYLGIHSGAYPSTAGYDLATGLGTPIASTLVAQLTAPAFTSPPATTFTVGVPGTFTVTTAGSPAPTVTESGALPTGVTFTSATRTLAGTPAQGTAGSYPITLTASNGTPVTQNFTLIVNQAVFTFPTDGQTNIDTTKPFTWSTIPQAQNFLMIVGTTVFGHDAFNSGILPSTTTHISVPALPPSPAALHATLFTEVNGTWGSYQAISFTAAPGEATFVTPTNGQARVDPTAAITWATVPAAQGYIVAVGTKPFGTDALFSGILPPTQSTFSGAVLPANKTLYATLFTEVNGAFSRLVTISFTTGPAAATFTQPLNGQVNVVTPSAFTWNTIARSQNYILVVGTTVFGQDLVNSGFLPPTASSFTVPKLPSGHVLYATLLTEVDGTWNHQLIGFLPAP